MIRRRICLVTICIVTVLALAWPRGAGDYESAQALAASRAEKDNLDLLAKLVCGEARRDPYEAKVAVAAVALNRTQDRRFPDSVAAVVYQTHAFASVGQGRIYRNTEPECYKAARAALAGWDPTGGALFLRSADAGSGTRRGVGGRRIGRFWFSREEVRL